MKLRIIGSYIFLIAAIVLTISSCATFETVGKNLGKGAISGLTDGVKESKIDSSVAVILNNIMDSVEIKLQDLELFESIEADLTKSLANILSQATLGVTAVNDSIIGVKAVTSINKLSETISMEVKRMLEGVGQDLNNSKLDKELEKFFANTVKKYLENAVGGLTDQLTNENSIAGFNRLADSLTLSLGEGLNHQAIRLSDTLINHLKPPLEDLINRINQVGQESVLGIKELLWSLISGIGILGLIFFWRKNNTTTKKYKATEKIIEVLAKKIESIPQESSNRTIKEEVSTALQEIGLEDYFRIKLSKMGMLNESSNKIMIDKLMYKASKDERFQNRFQKFLEENNLIDLAENLT